MQQRHGTMRAGCRQRSADWQVFKDRNKMVVANPQPARKFAEYFSHPNVTVTIVAGDSVSPLAPRTPREVLIVRDAWYPRDPEEAVAGFKRANRNVSDRIYFLSNTEELHAVRLRHGLNSHYVNIGCFVDESVFCPDPRVAKQYDAVLNARFSMTASGTEFKRHYLTTKIERLALLDPVFWSTEREYRDKYARRGNCKFINSARLPPRRVVDILRRAHVGLALSGLEGVCRASSEYLLTGLPVVSTDSVGGRDVWYDDYNSIIVPATEEGVLSAVETLKRAGRDPYRIRNDYLARAATFREHFRDDVLGSICKKHEVDWDLDLIMRTHPFRWWPYPSLMSRARWTPQSLRGAVRDFLKQRVIRPLEHRRRGAAKWLFPSTSPGDRRLRRPQR